VCAGGSPPGWPLLWWEGSPGNARLGTAAYHHVYVLWHSAARVYQYHHYPTPRRCAEARRRIGALTRDAML